jgi:threonine dehydratase
MELPTFHDVLRARRRIAPHLSPTPLHRYPAIDELLGFECYVKHENYHPVGAFIAKGGTIEPGRSGSENHNVRRTHEPPQAKYASTLVLLRLPEPRVCGHRHGATRS